MAGLGLRGHLEGFKESTQRFGVLCAIYILTFQVKVTEKLHNVHIFVDLLYLYSVFLLKKIHRSLTLPSER